ncbi:MAG: isocitrate lyase/phosphoenolpyruvate mutase family protein [Pyrinomonadaceae bacterium]
MTIKNRILPEIRRPRLKMLLNRERPVRLIEAHSGLAGLIGSRAHAVVDGANVEFDGLWISSLTSTAAKGLPDAELNTVARRLETIDEILSATDKPLLVDGDTGGDRVNFEYLCSKLEMMGVSGVVIEDKKYPKRNSLSSEARQLMEDPAVFAHKIAAGRAVLQSDQFLIFARIESFIAGLGLDDALNRAQTYLLAGADGILIHSKQSGPDEVYAFMQGYEAICNDLGFRYPVAVVPATYNSVSCAELFEHGIKVVIHSNHLLRASHLAMNAVCKLILESDRGLEANGFCTPLQDIFDLVGFTDVLKRDSEEASRAESCGDIKDNLLSLRKDG